MITSIHETNRNAAFSLTEVVLVIAIVGILASVGLGVYSKITDGAQANVAHNLTETLNGATRKFSHANWDLRLAADNASTDDEFRVLRSLQWREPDGASDELIPKGPFMRPDWTGWSSRRERRPCCAPSAEPTRGRNRHCRKRPTPPRPGYSAPRSGISCAGSSMPTGSTRTSLRAPFSRKGIGWANPSSRRARAARQRRTPMVDYSR